MPIDATTLTTRGYASASLNGSHCIDQAFPNYPVLGTTPKHLALPSYMEVSTPHCGYGSYIIHVPLLYRCWRPPQTLLALRKFALKNLLGQLAMFHASHLNPHLSAQCS